MQSTVTPISYKLTNEDIINISYIITIKLLNAIIKVVCDDIARQNFT